MLIMGFVYLALIILGGTVFYWFLPPPYGRTEARRSPPRWGKKIVAFLGALGTIAGLILFADWVRTLWLQTIPEITVDQSETFTPFSSYFELYNSSDRFDMHEVHWACVIVAAETTFHGFFLGNLIPEGSTPIIRSHTRANYRCRAGQFGLTQPSQIRYVTIQIFVYFNTLGLGHGETSDFFTWTPTTRKWIRGTFVN